MLSGLIFHSLIVSVFVLLSVALVCYVQTEGESQPVSAVSLVGDPALVVYADDLTDQAG